MATSDFETARKILARIRPDEITLRSTEAKVYSVAVDVLGADQDLARDEIFKCLALIHPLPKRRGKTPPVTFVSTGRPLILDRMMRIAADRAMVHPTPIGLGSSRGPRCE